MRKKFEKLKFFPMCRIFFLIKLYLQLTDDRMEAGFFSTITIFNLNLILKHLIFVG